MACVLRRGDCVIKDPAGGAPDVGVPSGPPSAEGLQSSLLSPFSSAVPRGVEAGACGVDPAALELSLSPACRGENI